MSFLFNKKQDVISANSKQFKYVGTVITFVVVHGCEHFFAFFSLQGSPRFIKFSCPSQVGIIHIFCGIFFENSWTFNSNLFLLQAGEPHLCNFAFPTPAEPER
jgi:hypothetical protein